MVTICHFDVPMHLVTKYGSWRNRKLVDYYLNFCNFPFQHFFCVSRIFSAGLNVNKEIVPSVPFHSRPYIVRIAAVRIKAPRKLVDYYLNFCKALFARYGKKVKYWLTFFT